MMGALLCSAILGWTSLPESLPSKIRRGAYSFKFLGVDSQQAGVYRLPSDELGRFWNLLVAEGYSIQEGRGFEDANAVFFKSQPRRTLGNYREYIRFSSQVNVKGTPTFFYFKPDLHL